VRRTRVASGHMPRPGRLGARLAVATYFLHFFRKVTRLRTKYMQQGDWENLSGVGNLSTVLTIGEDTANTGSLAY
jgi:hypothetical protein